MDYETEVLRFLREEPSLVIYNKLLKELGAAPAMFIAYLAEKFFRVSPTFDGYITVSIEEMEKEMCFKRGRQESSIKALKKNKYITMKPKEGSRKRQFKLLFQNFDPDGSYRTAIKNQIAKEIEI